MTILSRRRAFYEVTHMFDGVVVWKSPVVAADTETDAAIQAHAMRSDYDPNWLLIGDAPEGHDESVELVREAHA